MGVYYSHYVIPRDNTFRPGPDKICSLIAAWQAVGYLPSTGVTPVFTTDKMQGEYWTLVMSRKRRRGLVGWFDTVFRRKPILRRSEFERPFLLPPRNGSLDALSGPGTLVRWEIRDFLRLGTKYPLNRAPDPSWNPSYDMEIHLSHDFVSKPTDGYLGPCRQLDSHCVCGNDLKYEVVGTGIVFEEHRIRRECPVCAAPFRPQDQKVEIPISNDETYEEPGGLCYRFAIVVNCGRQGPFSEEESGDPTADTAFLQTCRTALDADLYEVSHYD